MLDYLVPGLMVLCCALALGKRRDGYAALLEGGKEGLKTLASITPALVMLLTCLTMLRASGAMELLSRALSPALRLFGIPGETAMLVLIRPISGSAALAIGAELMAAHGPDSLVGRTAAIMLGSTETTFYTLSVYFSAAGIQKTRYALPAALFADLVGFTAASWSARVLL